jgi:hypothetical protein
MGSDRSGRWVFNRILTRSLRRVVRKFYRLVAALRFDSGRSGRCGLQIFIRFVSGFHLLNTGSLDFCQVPSGCCGSLRNTGRLRLRSVGFSRVGYSANSCWVRSRFSYGNSPLVAGFGIHGFLGKRRCVQGRSHDNQSDDSHDVYLTSKRSLVTPVSAPEKNEYFPPNRSRKRHLW